MLLSSTSSGLMAAAGCSTSNSRHVPCPAGRTLHLRVPHTSRNNQPSSHVQYVQRQRVAVQAAEKTGSRWWEKETANMRSVNGVQELVDALADAGDALVIVDFYAQWCGACRALYPKLLKLMEEHPDVVFVKVDFEANRTMCKTLGVKVLPYFHVYHGALGRVAAFSCTVSKLQRMKDALSEYETPQCSLEPTPRLPEFPDIVPHPSEVTRLVGSSVIPAAELLMGAEAVPTASPAVGSLAAAAAAAAAPEPAGVA